VANTKLGWTLVGSLGLLIVLFLIWGFHAGHVFNTKWEGEASTLIQRFHQGFNSGDVKPLCDTVVICLGSDSIRDSWNSRLNRVRDRAGDLISLKSSTIHASIEPFSVRATCVASYDKAEVTENFGMSLRDEKLLITSYKAAVNGEQIPDR
jgi:hypothetical protein